MPHVDETSGILTEEVWQEVVPQGPATPAVPRVVHALEPTAARGAARWPQHCGRPG